MGEISGANGNHEVAVNLNDSDQNDPVSSASARNEGSGLSACVTLPFIQKMIAEILGTYFLIFAGCASVTVNLDYDKVVSLPGISIVWGLAVMVMVYSVGHISGAHFNPAVTIAFATCRRFPWKQEGTFRCAIAKIEALTRWGSVLKLTFLMSLAGLVFMNLFLSFDYKDLVSLIVKVPAYVICQVIGSTLASGTLRLIFEGNKNQFPGTSPAGTELQSFVVEFIITFYLMFVISGVATDNRAIGELAGLAVGATVLLNVMFAGPISGASMNPARSIGPAIVHHRYKSLWIYIVAPLCGAVSGAWVYNLIRFTDKPLREITSSGSFLKGVGRTR